MSFSSIKDYLFGREKMAYEKGFSSMIDNSLSGKTLIWTTTHGATKGDFCNRNIQENHDAFHGGDFLVVVHRNDVEINSQRKILISP